MSMITATTWVPRGFAAPFPQKYLFDEDEFERISQLARLQLDDAKDDLDAAKNGDKSDEDEEPRSNAAAIAASKDDMYACLAFVVQSMSNQYLKRNRRRFEGVRPRALR